MAKKTTKLTTFKSSESVVTDDYMNSIYGGLYGTSSQSLYSSTDPQVYGHVHDGEHLDGHAQKIHLANHVTGKLPISFIDGTIDVSPGLPLNSFQFNSADTFGGASSFLYQSSTDTIQFARDKKFYFGTIDSSSSFYIQNSIDSYSKLYFVSDSNSGTSDYVFRNIGSASVDLIAQFSPSQQFKFYGTSNASKRFDLGSQTPFAPWYHLYARQIHLYRNSESSNQKSINITVSPNQSQDYIMNFPILRPVSSNQVLKTITSGGTVLFTWDNYSSGGGGSYVEGLNIDIINNNTIETQTSVVFNTTESGIYYVGTTDVYFENAGPHLVIGVSGSDELTLSNVSLSPSTDQGTDLGNSLARYSSLYVDDILVNNNSVVSYNSTDLSLESNAGVNGSEITLKYSADNTSDIIMQTKGKGYLKSPYKNVMSEGHSGSPSNDAKTSFMNYTTTFTAAGTNIEVLKVEVLNQLSYGLINFDIVAAKIDKVATPNEIVDVGFSKNYLVVKRNKSGVNLDYSFLHPVGEYIDNASPNRFKNLNGQIAEVRFTVDSIVGSTSDTQTFNVVAQYVKDSEATDDSCDITITVKTTNIDGINIYRPS